MRDCIAGRRSIRDLRPGEAGTVSTIAGRGAVRQRLLDVGILPRTSIKVERLGPSGDPIWIKAKGCHLSLRRTEARQVLLEEC